MSALPLSSKQDAPVAWQIIVWLLLPLAVNSIIQSYARRGTQPLTYVSFSPFVIASEALSLPLLVLYARSKLDASWSVATRFVTYWSFRDDSGERSVFAKHFHQTRWLRWTLFLVTAGPALVILAASPGFLAFKACEILFAVSYLTIELFNAIPRVRGKEVPGSSAEALGYSLGTWNDDANKDLRKKAESLDSTLTILNVTFRILAFIIEVAISVLMFYDLKPYRWTIYAYNRAPVKLIEIVSQSRMAVVYTVVAVAALAGVLGVAVLIQQFFLPSNPYLEKAHSLFNRMSKLASNTQLMASISLISAWDPKNTKSAAGENQPKLSTYLVGYVVFCATYFVLKLLFLAMPSLGRLILGTDRVEEEEVKDEKEKTGGEITKTTGPVDYDNLYILTYACLRIPLFIVWCAVVYGRKETVGSDWTRVFTGK